MKTWFLALALLVPLSASAQETNMRAYTDACYGGINAITCEGWAIGNGFTPNTNWFIGQCNPSWCIENAWDEAGMVRQRRDDVCSVVHGWSWSCDDESYVLCSEYSYYQTCAGRLQTLDVSSLFGGVYYVRLWAWRGYPYFLEEPSPAVIWFSINPATREVVILT